MRPGLRRLCLSTPAVGTKEDEYNLARHIKRSQQSRQKTQVERSTRNWPRVSSVQDFVSYCRLVKCAKESSGKKLGTSGKKIGNVHLRWAFAEAAVLFIRQSQPGKEYFAKLEHKHGKAKALTVLAHKLGRAVYYMLTRERAFDLQRTRILRERWSAPRSKRRSACGRTWSACGWNTNR